MPIRPCSITGECVRVSARHVADGMALSAEAGWNQVAADWSLMIRLGDGFGIADPEGKLIASGFALRYLPEFGWISLILVAKSVRRRGFATWILQRIIEHLERNQLVPVLDATPAGEAVYTALGFRAIEPLTRWRGEGGGTAAPPVPSASPDDFGQILALDRQAFGADRSDILTDFLGRPGTVCFSDPHGRGFVMSRLGQTVRQLGPLVATDETAAVQLLDRALAAVGGPVLIDVPDRETMMCRRLLAQGFTAERPFMRMALGRDRGFGCPEMIHAAAGPEYG